MSSSSSTSMSTLTKLMMASAAIATLVSNTNAAENADGNANAVVTPPSIPHAAETADTADTADKDAADKNATGKEPIGTESIATPSTGTNDKEVTDDATGKGETEEATKAEEAVKAAPGDSAQPQPQPQPQAENPATEPNVNALEYCTFGVTRVGVKMWDTEIGARAMEKCIENPAHDDVKSPFMIAKCTADNEVSFHRYTDRTCDTRVSGDKETAKTFKSGETFKKNDWYRDLRVSVFCKPNCSVGELPPADTNSVLNEGEGEAPKPSTPSTATTPGDSNTGTGSAATPPQTEAQQQSQPQNEDTNGGNSKSAMGVLFAGALVFLGMNA